MRSWRNSLTALVLLWTAASSARAQMPPSPMMFPPSAPPGYFNPPPMSFAPQGPPTQNPGGLPVPRGYPIPGAEDPTELNRKGGSKNPLELVLEGGNAFSTEGPCECDAGCYAMIGTMAFMRSRLGGTVAAVSDLSSNIDQFQLPPANSPPALNFSDIRPGFDWGIRGAIGYRSEVHGVELFGFKVFGGTNTATAINPGRLAVPFAADPVPFGFGIDNGSWLNADLVQISLRSQTSNLEANYRYGCGTGVEFLCGIRYLDVDERFSIYTDDNGLTVVPPDPRVQSTYTTQAHSRIVGPQFGVECDNRLTEWLSAGLFTKLFAGANFYNTPVSLVRGDGFVSFDTNRNRTTISGAWDFGGYVDFLILARLRARLGYQLMWVLNVPEAASEVDFNLANIYGSRRDNGEIFYHGPMFELHFAF